MQPCPTFMKYNYCHDPECLNKHIKQDDKAGVSVPVVSTTNRCCCMFISRLRVCCCLFVIDLTTLRIVHGMHVAFVAMDHYVN